MIKFRQKVYSDDKSRDLNYFMNIKIENNTKDQIGFDIRKLKVNEDEFINAILEFEIEKNSKLFNPNTYEAVKKAVELNNIYWENKSLFIIWRLKNSKYFWSFKFDTPADPIEVFAIEDESE